MARHRGASSVTKRGLYYGFRDSPRADKKWPAGAWFAHGCAVEGETGGAAVGLRPTLGWNDTAGKRDG